MTDSLRNKPAILSFQGYTTIYALIAQEVEGAADELGLTERQFSDLCDIPENPKEFRGMKYRNLIMPLISAVQELSKQNDELREENNNQKTIINTILERLSLLEK